LKLSKGKRLEVSGAARPMRVFGLAEGAGRWSASVGETAYPRPLWGVVTVSPSEACGSLSESFWHCVPRMLAESFHSARLETRTKESNMHASWWVVRPRSARNLSGGRVSCPHHRPTMIFCDRFACEHACWDAKDGELCLSRVKPEETLVEARRCADVQIAFRTWV
jgi:hypothetical protein